MLYNIIVLESSLSFYVSCDHVNVTITCNIIIFYFLFLFLFLKLTIYYMDT